MESIIEDESRQRFEKITEEGRRMIRKEGVNFQEFKRRISKLFVKRMTWDEDFWVFEYDGYAYMRANAEQLGEEPESVEEWAADHYCEWLLEKTSNELKGWHDARFKPPHNLGVLVFIPDEDNHITSGMWDVSNKWVLLDENRTPDSEVTHWRRMPPPPKEFSKNQN